MRQEGSVIIGASDDTRQALRKALEVVTKVLGEASDYPSGHKLATRANPNTLFIDLGESPDEGLELIERLAEEQTGATIFVISKEKNPDLILRAVRRGARDFFVLPDDEAVIQRTIASLALEGEDKARRGRVLSVFSLMGGCGTTTLATNLAGYYAQSPQQRTILLDLDLYKGDASYFLNLESTFTLTDFLQNLNRIDEELLSSSLARHSSGLFVLGHPKTYEATEDITGDHATQILQTLRPHFDYIVVDCLKAINDVFLAVMDATDVIVLVALQTVPALKNTNRCLELFKQLGYDRNKVRVVLNRFTKRKVFSVANVEKALDWPISTTLPKLVEETMEAMNAGRLLQDTFPKVKLTQEIASLGGSLKGAAPEVALRSGLFGFLKKGG